MKEDFPSKYIYRSSEGFQTNLGTCTLAEEIVKALLVFIVGNPWSLDCGFPTMTGIILHYLFIKRLCDW